SGGLHQLLIIRRMSVSFLGLTGKEAVAEPTPAAALLRLRFFNPGRDFWFIELCDFFVHISQIVAGGEPRRRRGFFIIPLILGCRFPRGTTFANPIVACCGGRNWSIFSGLNRGQSLAKCEPDNSEHHQDGS